MGKLHRQTHLLILLSLFFFTGYANAQTDGVRLQICFIGDGKVVSGTINRKTSGRETLRSRDGSVTCRGRWKNIAEGQPAKIRCSNGIVANLSPKIVDKKSKSVLFRNAGNKVVAFLGTGMNEIRRRSQFAEYAARVCEGSTLSNQGGSTNSDFSTNTPSSGTKAESPKTSDQSQVSATPLGTEKREEESSDGTGNALSSKELEEDLNDVSRSLGISETQALALLKSREVGASATNVIVGMIAARSNRCAKLQGKYRADCLREGFSAMSKEMSQSGQYSDARQALRTVSQELEKIVRDTERKRDRSRGFRAIRSTGQEQAKSALLRTASLLRSVPNGDPRRVHYHRVAKIFDDSAVILRS